MNTQDEIVHFFSSEELLPLALSLFNKQKKIILELAPRAIVSLVGSSAIPMALTSGDLDILIQVSNEDFSKTAEKLKNIYMINHREKWNQEFALFHQKDNPQMPMSIVLVVKESKFDEHLKQTEMLKNNPDLLKRYNDLKKSFEGKLVSEYKKAKRTFFGPNGEGELLKERNAKV